MSDIALPASTAAATVLSALHAVGVPAFFDHEEDVVIAHWKTIASKEALDHPHVMISWTTTGADQRLDMASVRAIVEEPNGAPDFHEVATAYESSVRRPLAAEAETCARAVAAWLSAPGNVPAGDILLAALAQYGIRPGAELSLSRTAHSDLYHAPLQLGRGYGHLAVADRDGSVRHLQGGHTGWSILLHDESGDPVGDPVFITGDGEELVDCAEDSADAAAVLADWLTSPVSRHCDCHAQGRHYSRHDETCSRYRRP
ncbi:hypothetical protein ACIOG4_28005 [Streptomyces microflavus]|uniref:hypothetical protein n=1 Tax=Streptomyces microflavus TaxID=1919 RepID=UPI00380DD71A